MDEIEQVKERLDIAEVVSSYLTLKRAGANLKGNCPFHNEKTPSFMVNPERQIYKCFGCGEGGDVFTFIEKIEGVDFYNALKILADRAGVKLTSKSIRRGDTEHQADQKTTLFEINDLASKLYHKILTDHPKAEKARAYLRNRGMTEETIEHFQIGYAPESWDFLIRFMESKNFKKSDVHKAGLLVLNDRGEHYDRFRGRIIFPIQNVMGNCIGFTSRVLVDDGKQAKYINSSESSIYHKGKVLYGLDKAKMAIREAALAVIVEGNMDVIACHQSGFRNVVASSGTAITSEQINMLSRYAPDVAFAFDSDTAGVAAMKKALDIAIKLDISAKIIEIPSGFKDPDEALKKDRKIWELAVSGARSGIEVWIDRLCRKYDMSQVSNRKKVAKEVLPMIKTISSELEKEHYIKYLAKKLSVSESSLLKDMSAGKSQEQEVRDEPPKQSALSLHERILGLAWSDDKLAEMAGGKIASQENVEDRIKTLWQSLEKGSLKSLTKNPLDITFLDQIAYRLSLDYGEATPEELKSEMQYLISRISQDRNEGIKEKYATLIKEAQEAGDSEKLKQLLLEFSRLINK